MNKELRVTHCNFVVVEKNNTDTHTCNALIWYNINYVDVPPEHCYKHSSEQNETDYTKQVLLEEFDEHCKQCRIVPLMAGVRKAFLKERKKVRSNAQITFRDQYDVGTYGSDLRALGNLTVSIPKRPK